MGKFTPICDTISIMVLLVIWIFSFFPPNQECGPDYHELECGYFWGRCCGFTKLLCALCPESVQGSSNTGKDDAAINKGDITW